MSRFFHVNGNALEENKKTDKHIEEKETQEILSKQDRKLREIEQKAKSLIEMTNAKQFEKDFRKFIQDLKKYVNKGSALPDIVQEVFNKASSKQSIKLIDEFNNSLKTVEEETHEISRKVEIKPKELTLSEILDLEDESEKRTLLEERIDNIETLLPLYNIYATNNEYGKMINILKRVKTFKCNKAEYIKKNIRKYIHKFIQRDDYCDELLELFEMYDLQDEILYVKYFKQNKIVETDNELFKMVYEIKQGNTDTIDISNCNKPDTMIESIVYEYLAKELIKNVDYEKALSLYELFNERFDDDKLILTLLTGRRESEIFRTFLEEFKTFAENPFLLKSGDRRMEINRAFYLMNQNVMSISRSILVNLLNK
ncbi:hypothetical protein ECANGB1_1966 [Enterospora canceri]|uniref:Uncharacterized protein n=1 Tax=Enterospora canceri TaxID=1081671 RepID=A0A1Y1S5Z3_9MICR|nr:hypothetical protein ECANGB1_1966 [Enterospora canceri]